MPAPDPDQLDDDVDRVLAQINASCEGEFGKRERLAVKARGDPVMLQAVDEALSRAWERSDRSLWTWDCLAYTGAVLAGERAQTAQVGR